MNYQSYTDIVDYLRVKAEGTEALPPTFTSRQKRNFRMKIKSYSLNGSKLTRAGQEALHENNIEDTLRRIHEEDLEHTGHCKVLQQKSLAQYHAENLRCYCQDVTVSCTKCQEERMVILDIVPMYHLSHKTRGNICQTLMMPVENSRNRKRTQKLLVSIFAARDCPVHTQDYAIIDPDVHETIRIDCVQDKSSCFLDCVRYLTIGKKETFYPAPGSSYYMAERGIRQGGVLLLPLQWSLYTLTRAGGYRSRYAYCRGKVGGTHLRVPVWHESPQWNYVAGHKRGRGVTEVKKPFTYTTVLGWEKGETTRGIPSSLLGERWGGDNSKFILPITPLVLFDIHSSIPLHV